MAGGSTSEKIRAIYADQLSKLETAAPADASSSPETEGAGSGGPPSPEPEPSSVPEQETETAEPAPAAPVAEPPAPARHPEYDALLAEVGDLRSKARALEGLQGILATNPALRDAVFNAAQGRGEQAGLPENFADLEPDAQAKALAPFLVAHAREALLPEFRAEVESLRDEIRTKNEWDDLTAKHPEVARLDPQSSQEIRAVDQWLSRFSRLPRAEQPTLTEAYEAVMAPKWAEAARQGRMTQASAQRKGAANVARPGAGAPLAEAGVDFSKARNPREKFLMAVREAERRNRTT